MSFAHETIESWQRTFVYQSRTATKFSGPVPERQQFGLDLFSGGYEPKVDPAICSAHDPNVEIVLRCYKSAPRSNNRSFVRGGAYTP